MCIIDFSLTNFSSRIKKIIIGINYHKVVVINISGSQATLQDNNVSIARFHLLKLDDDDDDDDP